MAQHLRGLDGRPLASDGGLLHTPPTFTRSLANGVETNPFDTERPRSSTPTSGELRMMRAEAGGNPGFVPFGNAGQPWPASSSKRSNRTRMLPD